MVSTEQFRLLSALSERDVTEFAPSVAEDTGEIRYAEAERILDADDGAPYEELEELAELGILSRDFQGKDYVCPGCNATRMRFTTGCRSCGSLHTLETELDVHLDCGHADEEAAFFADDDSEEASCPECEAAVDPADDLEKRSLHVCQDCGVANAAPQHGLRCLECENVYPPSEVGERVLYRYHLDEDGETWVETQLAVRETLASSLEDRGFDVSIDENVGGDGETYAVDVAGTDELLSRHVVGAVHERPNAEAVETLVAAAEVADASPVLVTTSGALDAAVATIVDSRGIRVLSADGDGLVPAYDVVGEYEAPSVFQRLTSSVTERLQ